MNLPNLQPIEQSDNSISKYGVGKVSAEAFAHGAAKIKKAFPKLPIGWYQILEEALDEERFTDERFRDAVWNLIKTCPYPEPTIANVLGYDKKIKIYTYQELMSKYASSYYPGAKYDPIYSEYKKIEIDGQMRLVRNEDYKPQLFKEWKGK